MVTSSWVLGGCESAGCKGPVPSLPPYRAPEEAEGGKRWVLNIFLKGFVGIGFLLIRLTGLFIDFLGWGQIKRDIILLFCSVYSFCNMPRKLMNIYHLTLQWQ